MKTFLAFNKDSKLSPIYPVLIKGSIDSALFSDTQNSIEKVEYGDNDKFQRPIHFTSYVKPGKINNYVGLCTPPSCKKMLGEIIRYFKPSSIMVSVSTAMGNVEGYIDCLNWINGRYIEFDFHTGEIVLKNSSLSIIKDELGNPIEILKDFNLKLSLSISFKLGVETNTLETEIDDISLNDITQDVTVSVLGLKFEAAI